MEARILRAHGHAGIVAVLAACLAAATSARGNDAPWGYTIGEARPAQQVNICRDAEEMLDIARIFRKYGPRPGFSALANAPSCMVAVARVTPVRLVDELVISRGKPSEYRVRFVEVRVGDGATHILVTTRSLTTPEGTGPRDARH
jgi:hypothetical protein